MNKLDETLSQLKGVPTLLLHSCCGPCSSYVLEYLSTYFKITVFYYNPNITELEEYTKRVQEQKKLIEQLPVKNPVKFIEGKYEPNKFFELSKGLEHLKEGGARCIKCYHLRLEETAKQASLLHFDYFTTTLSVSPYKKADALNEIGMMLSKKYNIPYLYSNFKKKNGYKRSIELSKKYQLYRQDYCGCIYSKQERMIKNEQKTIC